MRRIPGSFKAQSNVSVSGSKIVVGVLCAEFGVDKDDGYRTGRTGWVITHLRSGFVFPAAFASKSTVFRVVESLSCAAVWASRRWKFGVMPGRRSKLLKAAGDSWLQSTKEAATPQRRLRR